MRGVSSPCHCSDGSFRQPLETESHRGGLTLLCCALGLGGLRPFPVAGGRGRCEPSQGGLRSSWKPQTRFQTKPTAGKGQSQGRLSGFRGTSLVHFAGGFCRLVLPGAIKNPSSLRWGPRRVLGPSCASAPCSVSFKLRSRRVEEGGCYLFCTRKDAGDLGR